MFRLLDNRPELLSEIRS
ncbi:hypothetical protein [Endozoicomonas sp. SESOKO2]